VPAQVTDDELLPLLAVMEEFRVLQEEVPVRAVVAFLYVATHNPCLMTDLQRDLKMHSSSASRCTDMLCAVNRLDKPGLNLVKKEKDHLMATRTILSLTPRGESFAASIKRTLY